jgi:hypothetical protein
MMTRSKTRVASSVDIVATGLRQLFEMLGSSVILSDTDPALCLEVDYRKIHVGKFLVENLTYKPVVLAIEPWADMEVLAPNEKVHFEYDEPGELQVAAMSDGSISVAIISDRVRVSAKDRERTFTTS